MRCQSFRTSLDQVTKSRCNSHGKYDRDCGCPEDSWYSIGVGEEKTVSQWNAIPPKFVKNAATDWHRFDFDGLRHKHGGYLKRLESISFSCLHWEQDKIDPESTAGQAICDNSLGHHQNCLHNMRKLPYDHLVLAILACNHTQLYTCRSTGCFTSCFLIGAMRWLSCKSAAKEVHLQIWPWPTKNSRPPSMICCHSGRWEEGFKLEAFPVPSLPTYGSTSGFSWSNYWASSGTACVQAKILQTG